MLEIAAPVLGPDREHYGFRYKDCFDTRGTKIYVFYGMGGFESALNYRFRNADGSKIIDVLNAETVLPGRIDPPALAHLGRLNLAYHHRRDAAFHECLTRCRRLFGEDLKRTIALYEATYSALPDIRRQARLFKMFGLRDLMDCPG